MSFENLDPQDKAILDAMVAGKSDEEVKAEFGVSDEDVSRLRGHLANHPPEGADNADAGKDNADADVGAEGAGEPKEGDVCTLENGEAGVLKPDDEGALVCVASVGAGE